MQCTSFYPNYAATWDTNNTPPRPAPCTAPAPAPVNRIISPGAGRGRGGFVNTATFVNTIMAKVPTLSGWKLLFVQPQIENIILMINMSSLKIYIYLQHSNVSVHDMINAVEHKSLYYGHGHYRQFYRPSLASRNHEIDI